MKPVVVIAIAGLFFFDCQKEPATDSSGTLPFEITPDTAYVAPGTIDEASGITDSKKNPGFVWVEQDSGNPPELALLSYQGLFKKKLYIKGAVNRDWEDITLGPGPQTGENYLYVAETGDNTMVYPDYAIYRMIEPAASEDTVYQWDQLRFMYPDHPHDCEALLLDPETKDIYLLTKRDSLSGIYKLPYPQSTTNPATAIDMGRMTITGVCSAALSPDGTEVLVKTYTNVYYWKRHNGESLVTTLQRTPLTLGYVLEPQGEAICFRNDNTGFFTLSEKPFFAAYVMLNLYRRK